MNKINNILRNKDLEPEQFVTNDNIPDYFIDNEIFGKMHYATEKEHKPIDDYIMRNKRKQSCSLVVIS